MPTKRTPLRRSHNTAAAARAWGMVFETGHDYLGASARFCRLPEPVHVAPAARAEAKRAWRAAAESAWRGGAGVLFLAGRDPARSAHATPWALAEFGPPPGWQDVA